MSTTIPCKHHGTPLEAICLTCKDILCFKCMAGHYELKHEYPVGLLDYASEYILPRYSTLLSELEKQKATMDASQKDFASGLPRVKERLVKLKEKLERLLTQVSYAIETLTQYQGEPLSMFDSLITTLTREKKDLQHAISKENMEYIIGALNSPEASTSMPGVQEGDRRSIEVVYCTASQLHKSREFEVLHEGITTLIENCKRIIKPSYYTASVSNQYVYGICTTVEHFKKLCRYDIESKKLTNLVAIPQMSTVLQVGKQVFISGGYNPNLNTLYEYMESSDTLAPKAPMNFARHQHRMISISQSSFMVIGGYNTSFVLPCEEYSIKDNSWKILPSLNQGRYSPAVTVLNNVELYAIGGSGSNDTIEKFDLKEKRGWDIINLIVSDIPIGNYPTAFVYSPEEIMILPGNNTELTGLFNVKAGTIKKYNIASRPEYHYCNSVVNIGGLFYTIGDNYGHIYTFDPSEKKLQITKHSKACS